MVDWTWASSPDIDPVASTQKHTSINPYAGIAKSSLELDFNFTAFPIYLLTAGCDFMAAFIGRGFLLGAVFLMILDLVGLAFLEGLVFVNFLTGLFLVLFPS